MVAVAPVADMAAVAAGATEFSPQISLIFADLNLAKALRLRHLVVAFFHACSLVTLREHILPSCASRKDEPPDPVKYRLRCTQRKKIPNAAIWKPGGSPANSCNWNRRPDGARTAVGSERFLAAWLLLLNGIAPRLSEDFVKIRLHSVSSLATLAVLSGVISWGGMLHAQQTSPDTQQTPPPADTQTPSAQTPSAETPAPPSQTQDQSAQPKTDQTAPSQTAPSAQASPSDAASGQTFNGTVVKQGDKYVLQDASTGTTYDIDHQDEVKKFEGKKVRVRGTLDASGKMIHVQ
jgi:hypothetical protein